MLIITQYIAHKSRVYSYIINFYIIPFITYRMLYYFMWSSYILRLNFFYFQFENVFTKYKHSDFYETEKMA